MQDFGGSEKVTDQEEEEEESLPSKMAPKTSTGDEKWWASIVKGKLLSRKRTSNNPKVPKDEGIGKRKRPRRRRKLDGHSEQSKDNSNGKQRPRIKDLKKGKRAKNFEFKDNSGFTSNLRNG